MCRAFEELMEEGRREGREEERQNVAQKMLAAGKFALEEIAMFSNLPLEAVKRLAEEAAQ